MLSSTIFLPLKLMKFYLKQRKSVEGPGHPFVNSPTLPRTPSLTNLSKANCYDRDIDNLSFIEAFVFGGFVAAGVGSKDTLGPGT